MVTWSIARSRAGRRCGAGFIARPNGAIDWLAIVERAGEDYGIKSFYASIDTIVTGRKTYETGIGFDAWPYTGMRCVVVTSDTARPSRHGEEFVSGDLAALFDRLGAEGARRVYVDGGTIIAQALEAGLIDDVTVSIIRSSSAKAHHSRPGSAAMCGSSSSSTARSRAGSCSSSTA